MNTKKMDYIERLSDNIILVNDVIVVKRGNAYTIQDRFESLSEREWDVLRRFLIEERVALEHAADSAVNTMLKELGIPRFYES
jgi:hypothetical protein